MKRYLKWSSRDKQSRDIEQLKTIDAKHMKSLRNSLYNESLTMATESDAELRNWRFHGGKDLETGLLYSCDFPSSGTVWKVNYFLDCTAEQVYRSIAVDGNTGWVPNTAYSRKVSKQDDLVIMQTKITGIPAISDRDFIYGVLSGQLRRKMNVDGLEATTFYSVCRSIPDGYYPWQSGCVRGDYLPCGNGWTDVVDEHGRPRCYATLIYNLDLKGFVPKKLSDLAASNFLLQHVKAAQRHARTLVDQVNAFNSSNDEDQ